MLDHPRRYLAPAAFLLAVTVAVVLVRSALRSGGSSGAPATVVVTTSRARTVSTGTTTTTARTAPRPVRRYWTVQAGDTYAVIASKSGVPVATLERLNPNVASTALFIGERIRIR